jgi:hypothetical protein
MALDPTTINLLQEFGGAPNNPQFTDVLTFNGDNAYPTGGYTAFSAFVSTALNGTRQVLTVSNNKNSGHYAAQYDFVNDALVIIDTTTGLEVPNGTDLHTLVLQLQVLSI